MSQTKRRRRTKHRGNAAGVVEARGRTGRSPTAAERKSARTARPHRLDNPPTWSAAAKRTLVILAPLVVVLGLVSKPPAAQLVTLAVLIFLIYVPLGYYTDLWMYKRRARQR